jgi:N-acetylmuramoyl-L-alanine amidase
MPPGAGIPDLAGLRIAVDVQHVFRPHKPKDRGSVYTLADGSRVNEADAAIGYAASLTAELRRRGASVLTNDPANGILVGYYSARQRHAEGWGALAYLACHVNAGGGRYSLMEYPSGAGGYGLAVLLNLALSRRFSRELLFEKEAPLAHGSNVEPDSRGWPCVGYFPKNRAAVLVEPFFGDTPSHQGLLSAAGLRDVGVALAAGVSYWFHRVH